MSGDVDEGTLILLPCLFTLSILSYIYIYAQLAGWQYALKFHGAVWHGMCVYIPHSKGIIH